MGKKTEEVNVGDDVIFGALSGMPYEIDKKKYFMMREADIIAII
jgi:co-chaperonin GroES (HSP10)